MKKIVCPYCDQPISGHYCKGCRRIVWKPVKTEITYYLNERHPQESHDCQFHSDVITGDTAEAKKAEIRERMAVRQMEKQKEQQSVPNVPRKNDADRTGSSQKTRLVQGSAAQKTSSSQKTGVSKIKQGLMICLILFFGSTIVRLVAGMMGFFVRGFY